MTLDELDEVLARKRPPTYPRGARGLVGRLWQMVRHRTLTAYAPADDHGLERAHRLAKRPKP